jgi:fluoride exporter
VEDDSLSKVWEVLLAAMALGQKRVAQDGWREVVKNWLFLLVRNKMVLVIVGGMIGTYARYWLGKWFNDQPWTHGLPYGTFVINVSGSFILGVAALVILERLPSEHENWYLLICTGFCGGYTTFSTFEWETFKLVRDGSWWYALANVFGSVLAGFAGILLAVALVNGIFPRR